MREKRQRSPGGNRGIEMRRSYKAFLVLLATAVAVMAGSVTATAANPPPETGTIDGANFIIEMPATWNGTLVLYSHGYVVPGKPLTATDAGDPATAAWLLDNGYAIAGSSYSTNGWALQQAFHDQIALLDHFVAKHGKPTRTIAWGHSLGGIITAGLIQLHPDRFAGAIPMCGVVAGGVGVWNEGLDAEFVFKTLAPAATGAAGLQLVNITKTGFGTGSNFQLAEFVAAQEQATPQGRARLALVAAVADTPGWFDTASAEPAPGDFAARELNQYKWDSQVTFPFSFALRAELEARAGGNPSWNTGVDYRNELNRSINKDEVAALYVQAGLDLNADLDKLADAPRISASEGAVSYLTKYIVFNGQLESPVLTMHTIGDGLVLPQDEQAYSSVVRSQDNSDLLRTTFVHRAGHCAFTPAETVTAFNTLIHRLNTGSWGGTTQPSPMNSAAAALGPGFNTFGGGITVGPSFVQFHPSVFLRPFDARNLEDSGDGSD
jgi:pimeloyl-ACP methyl ester carboxylesterase